MTQRAYVASVATCVGRITETHTQLPLITSLILKKTRYVAEELTSLFTVPVLVGMPVRVEAEIGNEMEGNLSVGAESGLLNRGHLKGCGVRVLCLPLNI